MLRVYIKASLQHLAGQTEENHKNLSRQPVSKQNLKTGPTLYEISVLINTSQCFGCLGTLYFV
jgi:hypothetical protein